MKEKYNILVYCADAGGAEIISSYIKKNLNKYNFICLPVDKAVCIFKKKHLTVKKGNPFKFLDTKNIKMVLVGRSWVNFDWLKLIKLAKDKKIKSVVYLDHWVNYLEVFSHSNYNEKNMPDEFWAGDMYAFNLAKKTFPKIPVKFVVNQYFKDIKSEFKKVSVKYFPSKILFLSSPVSISNKKYNFNEFDILKKILQLLADKKSKKELIIRFHPYDEKDKFDSIIEKSEIKVSKSSSKDILEDIAKADVIIGPETMALVISCLCGRKTVSCVTSGKSVLPFAKIKKVTKLNQLNKFIYF